MNEGNRKTYVCDTCSRRMEIANLSGSALPLVCPFCEEGVLSDEDELL